MADDSIMRLVDEIIAEIREAESKIWSVYMLINHTKKEIYFGVSKDVPDRIDQHADNQTKALKHWDFEQDNIEVKIIHAGLTRADASTKAHGYEAQYAKGIKGYKVIQTAGI